MSKNPTVPELYLNEFLTQQTRLVKNRVRLFCLMTIGLYFVASILETLVSPEEFRKEEIPLWFILIGGSALILTLNHKVRRLEMAKVNAYLFTALLLFLLIELGIIYVQFAAFTPAYYVLNLFFISLIIPWTSREALGIALLHFAAFSAFYAYNAAFVKEGVPVPLSLVRYIDGLILIGIASAMCFVIRRKETSRDVENYVLLKEVEEKNELIQKELELARRIHKTLIPDSVENERADVGVSYLPVHYIGGDYAKFHFLGKDRLIFVICDVTGHGVPAALLVNRIHAEFERLAKEGTEPGLLLRQLDQFITEDFAGTHMYLTAFCGLLDFKQMTFLYSNYGHPPQYIYHATRADIHRLNSQTTLLGLGLGEERLFQNEIRFGQGDRILLFTDGVIESSNEQGQEYGPAKLENFLKRNHQLSPQEFNRSLIGELNAFKKGDFKDDIFLLTLKVN